MKFSSERQQRDLTSGNLFKKIIIHLLPLFFANILQLLFTTMDIFTVTHFGDGNISSGAIGATTSIINLILCVFWGITNGVTVVVSNAKGAKDKEKVSRAIGSSILIMLAAGIIVLIFGICFAKQLLILLKTDEEFLLKSTTYLIIYFIGAPFNLLYNTGASILRAIGDTKRPFVAVLISGLINIGLNFLMVIAFKLDVAGVAIATIVSQTISCFIVFYYLTKDQRLSANFEFKYLRFYKSEALEILRIGLLSGLQSFVFNITNVTIQKSTNLLSNEAVMGKAASSNIEGYEYALLTSISLTCGVAVGQNYGAKNKKRVKASLWFCIFLETFLVTLFALLCYLLKEPLFAIFISNSGDNVTKIKEYASLSLLILGIPYALCGISECFAQYLRGMKYALAPALVSLICITGYRLIYIHTIFNIDKFHNFASLISTYPFSWILAIIVYIPTALIIKKKTYKSLD